MATVENPAIEIVIGVGILAIAEKNLLLIFAGCALLLHAMFRIYRPKTSIFP